MDFGAVRRPSCYWFACSFKPQTVTAIRVPDTSGVLADVALGFDNLSDWDTLNSPYFGVTVGRYANRIALGKFSLDGKDHQLATNNAPNHLHGGPHGFHKAFWGGAINGDQVLFTHESADGDVSYMIVPIGNTIVTYNPGGIPGESDRFSLVLIHG